MKNKNHVIITCTEYLYTYSDIDVSAVYVHIDSREVSQDRVLESVW